MRKVLAVLLSTLLASPAMADWTGKNATPATITFKNANDCTSVACIPIAQLTDGTGAALGVVGSPLFVGFGTGVMLPAFGSTPTFNLGTLNGAGTAANQASQLTQETSTAAALGTTADGPAAVPTTTTIATGVSLWKAFINLFTNGTDTAYAGSGASTVYGYFKGIYIALTGATTCLAGTTPTTQTAASSGAVTKLQCDLNGNPFRAPSQVVSAGTAGTPSTQVLSVQGVSGGTTVPVQQTSQYPVGSTPITASATGTTTATTATLAASVSIKTYICGFSIRANAAAAATNDSTVTGTITGTLHFTQWTAPNASGIGLTEEIFSPCIPSSAINTGIAVISGAPGTSGVVSVTAWGYQL